MFKNTALDVTSRIKFFLSERSHLRTVLFSAVALFIAVMAFAWYEAYTLDRQNKSLLTENASLRAKVDAALFDQQILAEEKRKLDESTRIFDSKVASSSAQHTQIDSIYTLYQDVLNKIKRNNNAGLDVKSIQAQIGDWGTKLLAQQYDPLTTSLTQAQQQLDKQYQDYVATMSVPPAPAAVPNPNGFSYVTVTNSRGSFGVNLIKLPLASYTVKTLTANGTDCSNNCPVKPLAQYIQENGAYAGMNGTYLCPPDYASCSSKVNSYDFPVYNSNLATWLNHGALGWTSIGLATFVGSKPIFYHYNYMYNNSPVTAAISNFPTLLLNGNIVVTDSEETAYQMQKGTKGAIGVDSTFIYLALVSGASVDDEASVLQTLGVKDALNLDGGGTSAMYIGGSYKVGPGRQLPNAVVLIKN